MARRAWMQVGPWLLNVGIEWSWPWGAIEGGKYFFAGGRTVCLWKGSMRIISSLYYFGPLSIGWAREVAE